MITLCCLWDLSLLHIRISYLPTKASTPGFIQTTELHRSPNSFIFGLSIPVFTYFSFSLSLSPFLYSFKYIPFVAWHIPGLFYVKPDLPYNQSYLVPAIPQTATKEHHITHTPTHIYPAVCATHQQSENGDHLSIRTRTLTHVCTYRRTHANTNIITLFRIHIFRWSLIR